MTTVREMQKILKFKLEEIKEKDELIDKLRRELEKKNVMIERLWERLEAYKTMLDSVKKIEVSKHKRTSCRNIPSNILQIDDFSNAFVHNKLNLYTDSLKEIPKSKSLNDVRCIISINSMQLDNYSWKDKKFKRKKEMTKRMAISAEPSNENDCFLNIINSKLTNVPKSFE